MKAHVCIGGPLDGLFATSEDFHGYRVINPATKKPYRHGERMPDGRWPYERDPGMYAHLTNEYAQFHNASSSRRRAHVVWIHTSLLPVAISPKQR
jgi:hypothetical protein